MTALLFYLCYVVSIIYFFFFSSRRRHTRCLSDWSSDVCSSDLSRAGAGACKASERQEESAQHDGKGQSLRGHHRIQQFLRVRRSEERRVGKECRSRGSPYH